MINKLFNDGNKLRYIYHFADIHLKNNNYQNYSTIFKKIKKFFFKLKDSKDVIILICGDVFHTKNVISPEIIILFCEFLDIFNNLPVIFIPGNHDIDIYNKNDKKFIIHSLLSFINKKNIFYLEQTGIYKYNNCNFYITNIREQTIYFQDLLDQEIIPKDEYKIALYHGQVQNCSLYSEIQLNKGISLKNFEGYDIVCLGDNHLQQTYSDNKIAYCGSLIQQHIGELYDKHGFIKWELETKTPKFINIKNTYQGFIKLKTEEDIEKLKEYSIENCYIHNYIKDLELDYVLEQINNDKLQIKLFKNIVISSRKKIDDSEENDNNINNLVQNINFSITELIEQDIENKDLVNKREKILTLFEKIKNECKIENFKIIDNESENLKWTISKIEFKNLMNYSKDKLYEISFDDSQSLFGVFGNNAIGKTSILIIICFAIFGSVKDMGLQLKDILNYSSTEGFTKITLCDNKKNIMIIERRINGKYNKFKADKSDIVITRNGELCKEDLDIGTLLSFQTNNILSNTYSTNIFNETPTNFTNKLLKIFNMTQIQKVYDLCVKKYNKNIKDLNVLEGKLEQLDQNISNETNDVKIEDPVKYREDYNEIEEKNKKIKKNLNNLQNEKDNLLRSITNVTENEYDKNEIEEKIKNYKDKEYYEKLVKNYDNKIYILKSKLKKLNYDKNLEYKYNNIEIIENIKKEKIEQKQKLFYIDKNLLKNENKFITNENIQTFYEFLKDKNIIKKLLKNNLQDIDELLSDYCKTDTVLNKITNDFNLNKIQEYKNLIIKNREIDLINKNIEENIEHLNVNIKFIKYNENFKKLEKLQQKVKEISLSYDELLNYINILENIENIEKNKTINEKINIVNEQMDQENIILLENTEQMIFLQEKIKFLNNSITNKTNLLKNKKLLDDKLSILEYLKCLFDKDNLPRIIILHYLKNIEDSINNKLCYLTDISINFESILSRGKNIIEFGLYKNNILKKKISYRSCSGFERFVINLIFKICISELLNLNNLNLFLVDEQLDCISTDNEQKIDILFEYLKNINSQLILRSHNEYFKDKISNFIKIEYNEMTKLHKFI